MNLADVLKALLPAIEPAAAKELDSVLIPELKALVDNKIGSPDLKALADIMVKGLQEFADAELAKAASKLV